MSCTEHSGVAVCHRYGVCTVCCVECVALNTVVWQCVIGMVCVLFAVLSCTEHSGVAACHRYGMCAVCCVE